ncbi:MAG: amino acid adenylation domain-containing protein [Phycisphaerales bacterium]
MDASPGEPLPLPEIFERIATVHPTRIAVDVPPGAERPDRTRVTYAALRRRAHAIAAELRGRLTTPGAEPVVGRTLDRSDDEPIVVVFLPREDPALYAAQLGILAAGAAFTCIDPRFPDSHVRAVLADAEPAAIVTDARGRARLAAIGAPSTALLDAEAVEAAMKPDGGDIRAVGPNPVVDSTRLAYVIYTSGTTGRPKGVMIEHRSIANLVRADIEHFGLGPHDRVGQCSSPSYDSSIEETWLAFAAGATLVILDDEAVRLGPDLVGWLRQERISVLCPPPTLLRSTGCADPLAALPDLRLLYVGGEALPQDLADLWARGRWLENGYGPTECTVTVVRGRVREGRPVTIGRVVDGHRDWILDASLEEVPDGETGELCIGGVGLARGYRHLPALTAERFPIHPRLGRIHRTGDLVRRNRDGELECLGRIDSQVKLRGYRVELEAIEARLVALPGVRAAACHVQGEPPSQVLAAHVVPDSSDGPPDLDALRRALREALPEYMVPARLALIDALPTSVGGKLDRRRLPAIPAAAPGRNGAAPGAAGRGAHRLAAPPIRDRGDDIVAPSEMNAPGDARRSHAPPCSGLDRRIADAFGASTGVADVSVDDDFFLDLGGDSLGAVGVVCALRAAAADRQDGAATDAHSNGMPGDAGRDGDPLAHVAVRDLYEARTAAALAERLRERAAQARERGAAQPSMPAPGAGESPDTSRPSGRETTSASCDPTTGSGDVDTARGVAAPIRSTCVQALCLVATLVAAGATSSVLALDVAPFVLDRLGPTASLLLAAPMAMAGLALYAILTISLTIAAKRVLVGRYRPGAVAVWSDEWTRHWIVAHCAHLVPWWLLEGTVFLHDVLRALGATIGHRVHLHRGVDLRHGGWDLLAIGDDATVGQDATIALVDLDRRCAVFGAVTIGARATIDVRAGLAPGSTVGRDGFLTALSWLPPGETIPPGERWDGVPAAPAGLAPAAEDASPHAGAALGPRAQGVVLLLARFGQLLIEFAPAGAMALVAARLVEGRLPDGGASLLAWLRDPLVSRGPAAVALAIALLVVVSLPFSLAAQALSVRWLGPVRPGTVSRWGLDYIRIWLKTGAVDGASRWLSGTLYWPWWLRLAGMRIERGCEISTIIDVVPETVRIGRDCFFADGIYLSSPRVHRGMATIAPSAIGAGTFLGNHAVVPAGRRWPDDLFVGVATVAQPEWGSPDESAPAARRGAPGKAWFGHPPMELPRREVAVGDRRLTHEPGSLRRATRLFWETLRFALPVAPIVAAMAWYRWILLASEHGGVAFRTFVVAPLATLGAAAMLSLAVVALKWILLGRVHAGRHPLWSCWCSRWDFLYVAWSFWARGPLAMLEGTLLLNAFLRLVGMRIGRRVVLGAGFAHVVDPDMLHFDDDTTIACQFQAHSFEDRILKIDHLHIRRDATVGDNAIVFYGAEIGAGTRVAPHSVVMKRDVLEPGRRYIGCPTRPR